MTKVGQLLMGFFFLYSAIVQLNDPDAYLYFSLYGISAFVAIADVFEYNFYLLGFSMYCCTSWLLVDMFKNTPVQNYYDLQKEVGREQSGMTILVIWHLSHYLGYSKQVSMVIAPIVLSAAVLVPYFKQFQLGTVDNPDHCSGIGLAPQVFNKHDEL